MPPLTIRLNPVSRQCRRRAGRSVAGDRNRGHPRPRPCAGRAQVRHRADRRWRGSAQVRPDTRLCDRGDPARRSHPYAQHGDGRFRPRLFTHLARNARKPAEPGAVAQPGDVPGHRPPGRTGCDAQLPRRPHHRELLGQHGALYRRAVPHRHIARLSEHRRRRRPRPRHRLRDGDRRRADELLLRRTIGGYARHPNFFAGVLVLGPRLRDQPDLRAPRRRGASRRAIC